MLHSRSHASTFSRCFSFFCSAISHVLTKRKIEEKKTGTIANRATIRADELLHSREMHIYINWRAIRLHGQCSFCKNTSFVSFLEWTMNKTIIYSETEYFSPLTMNETYSGSISAKTNPCGHWPLSTSAWDNMLPFGSPNKMKNGRFTNRIWIE